MVGDSFASILSPVIDGVFILAYIISWVMGDSMELNMICLWYANANICYTC